MTATTKLTDADVKASVPQDMGKSKMPKRRDLMLLLAEVVDSPTAPAVPLTTIAKINALLGRVGRAKPKRVKEASRSRRWADAASDAAAALDRLLEVQQEYSDWKDNLPENLQQSALGQKLEDVCGIDIESAKQAADEAESADLPVGFGRD